MRMVNKVLVQASTLMLLVVIALLFTSESSAQVYSTISGHVIEVNTNQPVSGVQVIAVEEDSEKPKVEEAISNSKGLYVLKDITPGIYTLYLKQINNFYFEAKTKKITVPIGKNVVNVNFILKKSGSVSGTIYQADGLTPYANVGIVAQAPEDILLTGVTDANGYYKIEGLPQTDTAYVSVLVQGVGAVTKGDIKIVGGKDTGNINFAVKKDISNLSISGNVLSNTTLSPIGKARILIVGDNSTAVATSDVNGNFEIYGLPTGRYDILITAIGYETTARENMDIFQGSPLPLEFQMVHKGSGSNLMGYFKFFSSIFDIAFVNEAYAQQNSCDCVSCEPLADYYSAYASKHQFDANKTFANSLTCVANGLCGKINSKSFGDNQWVLNTMNCLQIKFKDKGSTCWQSISKLCDKFSNTFAGKLGCFLGQLNCHWGEDLIDCENSYGVGTTTDISSTGATVMGCTPTFLKSLYW